MPIRLLIADDHAVVRQGLRTFLSFDADLELVGEARDGREAVEMAGRLKPDVLLMDLMMPEMDGIAATTTIRRDYPEVEVIALTSVLDDASVADAVRAGAIGYLLKNASPQDLLRGIRAAAAGQVFLSPEAAAQLVRQAKAGLGGGDGQNPRQQHPWQAPGGQPHSSCASCDPDRACVIGERTGVDHYLGWTRAMACGRMATRRGPWHRYWLRFDSPGRHCRPTVTCARSSAARTSSIPSCCPSSRRASIATSERCISSTPSCGRSMFAGSRVSASTRRRPRPASSLNYGAGKTPTSGAGASFRKRCSRCSTSG